MRPGPRSQRLAPVTIGPYSTLQVCPPQELEPSCADFPARLVQLLSGHGTAAPLSLLEVVWVMGGDPLRIHTDTLLARNGVINLLQSLVQAVIYSVCTCFLISCSGWLSISALS